MLILGRHTDEAIVITVGGERIVIMVVEAGFDRVRLGFEAGPNVVIHREEVQQLVDRGEGKQQIAKPRRNLRVGMR
jgi:carbon storage regulator CsrA